MTGRLTEIARCTHANEKMRDKGHVAVVHGTQTATQPAAYSSICSQKSSLYIPLHLISPLVMLPHLHPSPSSGSYFLVVALCVWLYHLKMLLNLALEPMHSSYVVNRYRPLCFVPVFIWLVPILSRYAFKNETLVRK